MSVAIDDELDASPGEYLAVFAGPDDEETCDGCEDAVAGNPYPFEECPVPGSFECMSKCRHFVQLSENAPDDLAPFEWRGVIGFGSIPGPYYEDVVRDQDQMPSWLISAGRMDEPYDPSTDGMANAGRLLRDLALGPGNVSGAAPSIDLQSSLSDALDDANGGNLESLAKWLVAAGLTPDDMADTFWPGATGDTITAIQDAFNRELTAQSTRSNAIEWLQTGQLDKLKLAAQQPEFLDTLRDIASDGFSANDAMSATLLGQVLDQSPTLDSTSGRWTFREADDYRAYTPGGIDVSGAPAGWITINGHHVLVNTPVLHDPKWPFERPRDPNKPWTYRITNKKLDYEFTTTQKVIADFWRKMPGHTVTRESFAEGGPGSGDPGHLGRKGQRGGSLPGPGNYSKGKRGEEQAKMPKEWFDPNHRIKMIEKALDNATDGERKRGMSWYEDAHAEAQKLADKYNLTINKAAAVIAAMSPQQSWERNLESADKLCSDPSVKTLHLDDGSGVLGRSIINAGRILNGESPELVLNAKDNTKSYNFYRNILDPSDPNWVTIDRHAVALSVGSPLLAPQIKAINDSPLEYKSFADAYRQVAADRGMIPNDVQAITWTHWTVNNARSVDRDLLKMRGQDYDATSP